MLWRVAVAEVDGFFVVVGDPNDAVIAPGEFGDVARRQDCELTFELRDGPMREVLTQADETLAAVGIVLGLAEKVTGDECGIGRIVGDDEDLRGSGKQIDTATAEQLAFGFRDESVAGAAKHVDGIGCQSRPKAISAMAGTPPTTKMLSAPALWIALMVAGYQPWPFTGGVQAAMSLHSGDARRNDAHLRRAEHRVAPAGDIAADRIHGNVLVAEDDAGLHLHFERQHGAQLRFGKAPDVILAVVGVLESPASAGSRWRRRFVPASAGSRRIPIIELAAVSADGVHAVSL